MKRVTPEWVLENAGGLRCQIANWRDFLKVSDAGGRREALLILRSPLSNCQKAARLNRLVERWVPR